MISHIDPILLFVHNFQKCLAFYRDVLGLPLRSQNEVHEEFAEFDLGNLTFALHGGYEGEGPVRHGSKGRVAIHFHTENIQATIRHLRENGAKITREPELMPWNEWEATFEDPEGNERGLIQPA